MPAAHWHCRGLRKRARTRQWTNTLPRSTWWLMKSSAVATSSRRGMLRSGVGSRSCVMPAAAYSRLRAPRSERGREQGQRHLGDATHSGPGHSRHMLTTATTPSRLSRATSSGKGREPSSRLPSTLEYRAFRRLPVSLAMSCTGQAVTEDAGHSQRRRGRSTGQRRTHDRGEEREVVEELQDGHTEPRDVGCGPPDGKKHRYPVEQAAEPLHGAVAKGVAEHRAQHRGDRRVPATGYDWVTRGQRRGCLAQQARSNQAMRRTAHRRRRTAPWTVRRLRNAFQYS